MARELRRARRARYFIMRISVGMKAEDEAVAECLIL
jgi:hypothetical protein